RSATPMLLAVAAAMSVALAAVAVAPYPEASFYLLPTRAWELLLGACLSYRTEVTKPAVAETATVLGGATLLFSILLFDSLSPVPGPITPIPCGGAALILVYGDKSSFGQNILASKPLVWIGRISYSLYLSHWPIKVFARHYWQDPRGMGAT